nr:MAG: hypothetical protein DIU59_17890 [Pseudomonadota bacterium]
MTLPDYQQAWDAARPGEPFSTGSEAIEWMSAHCDRCIHDAPTRRGRPEDGCPLTLVALLGRTPAEWVDRPGRMPADQYRCKAFRTERSRRPAPDPNPNQMALFAEEPR